MQNEKYIKVMAIYTLPKMWKAILRTNKAVQGSSVNADADYIAFIRLGLEDEYGDAMPGGVITHIAKVKKISFGKSLKDLFKESPEFIEIHEEKEWEGNINEYQLERIEELSKPIPHRRGDRSKSQVKFFTTMDELKKANVLSDIKTLSQLKEMGELPK